MPHYEIIFETGAKSVAFYEDNEEMLRAVSAHQERAKTGVPGGPYGGPAERIKEVQKYNEHPDTLNELQTMSADVMAKELAAIVKDKSDAGAVSIPEVVSAVRELSSPLVLDAGAHESMFKMKAEEVITEGWDK